MFFFYAGNARKVQGMLGNWDVNAANEDLVTALHVAAVRGNAEMANVLINSGANVNIQSADGQTPLHVSARNGNLKFSEMILSHGATTDAIDQNGVTPLQLAVFEGTLIAKTPVKMNEMRKSKAIQQSLHLV